MKRVLILNKQTALRAKELGKVGEAIAPRYLKRAGFQSVSNLNDDEKTNHPFFDALAFRNGVNFAISIKSRNIREANGNINPNYKLFNKGDFARVRKVARKLSAVPAWLAIQFDGEKISIYFGIWDQRAGQTGIPMMPDDVQNYECLANHEPHGLDIEHLKNTYEIRQAGLPKNKPRKKNNIETRMVLRLQSGRKIYLDEIVQWRTYSSLLLGIPDKQMNDEIIARALQIARKKIDLSVPIHLLQPPRENLNFSRNKSVRPHREYERIPPIACAAAFESSEPARDKECFYSCLIFLWFQNDWALPIAPRIASQIRKANWNELAEDCMP